MVVTREPRQEPLAPEAELGNVINHYLSLDEAAGPSGQGLATQAVTSMVEVLNFMGGDLWAGLHKNNINNLLELGLRTSVVVCTFPYQVLFSCLYVLTHPVFSFFLQNILSILRYNSVRESRENDFRTEIAEKEKTLQDAESNAKVVSKKHFDQLEHMAACVNNSEKAKE